MLEGIEEVIEKATHNLQRDFNSLVALKASNYGRSVPNKLSKQETQIVDLFLGFTSLAVADALLDGDTAALNDLLIYSTEYLIHQ